ncbi:MAG TPA: exodeoxyribonuclease VII large subunit [Edaphobacter sp.]|jgi:exodeoxyribonuclease VII large subunit|nr:exodeoxyribonuclease VII large subunit [Edaphobacter sp.]
MSSPGNEQYIQPHLFPEPGRYGFEPEKTYESPEDAVEALKAGTDRVTTLAVERRIWTVRALVNGIRHQIETNYTDIWVEGEISNCRSASSGHIYFTLKDGESQLAVVVFRRQAALSRFRPTDGMAVLVRGRVSIYEGRGELQLIAEILEPRGAGSLQLAFEQLKERLRAEGLFDTERKRQLPAFPKCIGIITSPSGAVVRDIVTIVRRRHSRLDLLVYPATMQGESSPDSVAGAIRWFNANSSLVDLIVIARGGGSLEDLAPFNDEVLARTIAASSIPVVTAIGHETDFTIADFVADLRAATPSAAAELITTAQHRVEERIQELTSRVERAGRFHLIQARQDYIRLSADSVFDRLHNSVGRREQHLDEMRLRLENCIRRHLQFPIGRLAAFTERLYRHDIPVRVGAIHRRLQNSHQFLLNTFSQTLTARRIRLNHATTRLEALSPLAVLSRGYAIVYAANGSLLRTTNQVTPGELVRARLAHGTLEAVVMHTTSPETGNGDE